MFNYSIIYLTSVKIVIRTMGMIKNVWGTQKQAYLLALLPPVFLTILVIVKAVNVPYWDQWEFVPLIQHVHGGHFYFQDFWQQQNEHRLVFPRLVMVTAALITHWNVRVESLISIVIAACSFVFVIKTWRLTHGKYSKAIALFLPLILSVIWFSPVQVENWLWGWQIQWFLNVLGIMLVAWGIAGTRRGEITYPNLLVMLGGGILATYSLGNGVIIWPLLIATLIYLRVFSLKTAIAALTGLAAIALYYLHYVRVPQSSSPTDVFKMPVLFAKYVLVYLGRPLSFVHKLAPILGLVLLLVFIGLSAYLFIKKKRTFTAMLPWVVIGFYAIGTAMITAVSRMNLGLDQAYNSSRYTTIASLLLVSTVLLAIECSPVVRSWLGTRFKSGATVVAAVFLVLVLSNAGWGLHATNTRSNFLKGTQVCTHVAQPSDACLRSTYPYPNVVQPRLNYLKQIHWAGY
jgi:hypothetical protein